MADLTVTVSAGADPTYSPAGSTATNPLRGRIRQGGTVEFVFAGTIPVTVTFPNGSPFTQTGTIQLGGPSQLGTQDKTVAAQAVPNIYQFDVAPQPDREKPGPPSTVSGDLEVTPDY
ncbi:hypothetical protein SAMN05444354_103439 [Stigmatella aurantiaca]|uniref:Uncharacterized protein n=1 Tax=Stigmatella aurantiaca TaxID=41 RepID=A0A1H7M5N5_STIAU|nr:hypothetical protein [Stigmatella aurantiaca]SEL06419.1 hypothetical protein SAMN05444354_103439 [Stigmatella aurantiaca]